MRSKYKLIQVAFPFLYGVVTKSKTRQMKCMLCDSMMIDRLREVFDASVRGDESMLCFFESGVNNFRDAPSVLTIKWNDPNPEHSIAIVLFRRG